MESPASSMIQPVVEVDSWSRTNGAFRSSGPDSGYAEFDAPSTTPTAYTTITIPMNVSIARTAVDARDPSSRTPGFSHSSGSVRSGRGKTRRTNDDFRCRARSLPIAMPEASLRFPPASGGAPANGPRARRCVHAGRMPVRPEGLRGQDAVVRRSATRRRKSAASVQVSAAAIRSSPETPPESSRLSVTSRASAIPRASRICAAACM